MVINLWRYKKFIYINAINDLRHRYAGSMMGVFWNVLNPLMQIFVFTLVFSQIMKIRLPEISSTTGFAIYLCSGMLPWLSFSECVTRGADSFIENAAYLKKLPIPEQIFVAKTAMSSTLSLAISMLLLFIVILFLGAKIDWNWLLVLIILILFQCLGFGLGLILSSLNVFFRDIGQMLGIILQIGMWLVPIVYTTDILPERFAYIINFNPAFPFIDAIHMIIVYGTLPVSWEWAAMLFYAMTAPIIGYLILRKLRPEIRDVL